jgi:Ca2+-binding RTX toxin-like protein
MKFPNQSIIRISLFCLLLLIIGTSVSALAAANTVPVSYADDITIPIDQNQFYPSICAGITIQNVIYAIENPQPVIQGTEMNDLIFGTDDGEKILGKGGDDCILGNGGNDKLLGMEGNDVLDGGDGYDTLKGGSGDDNCFNGENVSLCEF